MLTLPCPPSCSPCASCVSQALRAGDTTFVYFGEAVALRGWWQADASVAGAHVGTTGTIAVGSMQMASDVPPTLTKRAQRQTDLDIVKVEIIDNQGSFVSEDPRKGARIFISLVQLRSGQADLPQELTLTVGATNGLRPEDDKAAGSVYAATDNQFTMQMQGQPNSGDTVVSAPGVGDVAPQPGTTLFVGLRMSSPQAGNYEVRLSMAQDGESDCTGCDNPTESAQTGCGCTDVGCCLASEATGNTWADSIAAGAMADIPEFRLGLTMLVGVTSVVDTEVPNNSADLKLDITPIQSFQLKLKAKDSADNLRPEGGDLFQMRMYPQEGEVACGDYVTPASADAAATLDGPQAATWCGADACPSGQNSCPATNRAKRIQPFEETCLASSGFPEDCALTPASGGTAGSCAAATDARPGTCTYRPGRLVCTDDAGSPLCQKYNTNTLRGGATAPGVFPAAEAAVPGEYLLDSLMIPSQTISMLGVTISLQMYGTYVIVIEGQDAMANATYANVIGGMPWVELALSPKYGRISPVDCSGVDNALADPPSPLLGGLMAPLLGSESDKDGKLCRCKPGYERNLDYNVRLSADDPPSSGLLPGQVVCVPCGKGYHKDTVSNTLTCAPCPVTTTTQSGVCREKIRAVSSSKNDDGFDSTFGDLVPSDAEWHTTHHDFTGEADCDPANTATLQPCRRGNPAWRSVRADSVACDGVIQQGIRAATDVLYADKEKCESLPTEATANLNATYQIMACVYEPSMCERGECISKDMCQCQDRTYDFRNVYVVCQKTEWFRLEDSQQMSGGAGKVGLISLHASGTYCADCPDCVHCFENGTVRLKPQYWTFDEEMKYPAPYYWDKWAVPLKPATSEEPLECPASDPYRCPVTDHASCPDQKCIYAQNTQSTGSYKHWMITAYKCLHSPGGPEAPTCLGGDWTLATVKSGANSLPEGTDVACRRGDDGSPVVDGRPGCDLRPATLADPVLAQLSNGFCMYGSAGITCAVCANGFKKDKGGAGCANCEEAAREEEEKETNYLHVFVVLLTVLITIGLAVFAMKRAKTDDILKIKILIAFGQVMQSFASTYSITWPPIMAQFIDQFSVVSFDLFTIGSVECVESMRWVKGFFAQFSFMVTFPVGVSGLLFLGWWVSVFRDKKDRAERGQASLLEQKIAAIELQGAWSSRWFFMLILIYLKVSSTVLEMFRCRTFEPYPPVWEAPEKNMANSYYQITQDTAWEPGQDDGLFGDGRVASDHSDRTGLEKDMRHTCTETVYIMFYTFAVFMVFLYPFGIPFFFVLLMWREREQISDAINQKKFGFLFADYVTMYFLWEVLDLFRKLLLSGLMIFFNRGSVGQLIAGMIVALTFLEMQLRLMPYNDLLANLVQIVAFNAIFLNLLGAMLTKVKYEDGVDSSVSADFANKFLIFINISVPICVLFMLAFSVGYDM